jgi:hypothetical protein
MLRNTYAVAVRSNVTGKQINQCRDFKDMKSAKIGQQIGAVIGFLLASGFDLGEGQTHFDETIEVSVTGPINSAYNTDVDFAYDLADKKFKR